MHLYIVEDEGSMHVGHFISPWDALHTAQCVIECEHESMELGEVKLIRDWSELISEVVSLNPDPSYIDEVVMESTRGAYACIHRRRLHWPDDESEV